jgi:hypothetical protein
MSHRRYGGALGRHAEHIKAWLRRAKKEDDLEAAREDVGAGKT